MCDQADFVFKSLQILDHCMPSVSAGSNHTEYQVYPFKLFHDIVSARHLVVPPEGLSETSNLHRLESRSTVVGAVLTDEKVCQLLKSTTEDKIVIAVDEFVIELKNAIASGQSQGDPRGLPLVLNSPLLADDVSEPESVPNELHSSGESDDNSSVGGTQDGASEPQSVFGSPQDSSTFRRVLGTLQLLQQSAIDGCVAGLRADVPNFSIALVTKLKTMMMEVVSSHLKDDGSCEAGGLQGAPNEHLLKYSAIVCFLAAALKVSIAILSVFVPSSSAAQSLVFALQEDCSNESIESNTSEIYALTRLINYQITVELIHCVCTMSTQIHKLFKSISLFSSYASQQPANANLRSFDEEITPAALALDLSRKQLNTMPIGAQEAAFALPAFQSYFTIVDASFFHLREAPMAATDFGLQITTRSSRLLLSVLSFLAMGANASSLPWLPQVLSDWLMESGRSSSAGTAFLGSFRLESYFKVLCNSFDTGAERLDVTILSYQQTYESHASLLMFLDLLRRVVLSLNPLHLLPPKGAPVSSSLIGLLVRSCRVLDSDASPKRPSSVLPIIRASIARSLLQDVGGVLNVLFQHEDTLAWMSEAKGNAGVDVLVLLGLAAEELDEHARNQECVTKATTTAPPVQSSSVSAVTLDVNIQPLRMLPFTYLQSELR